MLELVVRVLDNHVEDLIRDAETGKWLDSSVFRQQAILWEQRGKAVKGDGYYCEDPWGSPAWQAYWQEQLDYCIDGFTVGNWRITGHHYFYQNFTQIMVAVQISADVAEKKLKFPDFWDGDYDYFWSLEIARNGARFLPDDDLMGFSDDLEGRRKFTDALPELAQQYKLRWLDSLKLRVKPSPDHLNGGHNMIVGKARRKGYSYKNGAICANTYNTRRESLVVVGANEKKFLYPTGTMQMASDYLNFLNTHTGWRKSRDFVDRVDHRRASFKKIIGGVDTEAGYKSQIMAITFMDKPDAARGKDPYYVLLEEAGAFPNLEATYNAIWPSLRSGRFSTGQIIIFGTGGDMASGTADFAKMFYNPTGYRLMPFINIWDQNAENTLCGFFHPFYWNFEGYYDEQGNSDSKAAIADEIKYREEIMNSQAGSGILQARVQEMPMSPSEAFLTVSFNDFPVVELRNQYNKVIRERLHIRKGQPVHLFRDEQGKAAMKPDLHGELIPIWDYIPKVKDLTGCVVMFEAPMDSPPRGLYKIGYDPYRQVNGSSLACITVYKGVHKHSISHRDTIVAQYVGRPKSPDDVNRISVLLAELYNTEVMYENEVTHVKNYYERNKKLDRLAAQPDAVISANIENSRVARIYGMHMVEKLKDAGEKYIKAWLLTVRDIDEFGNEILNLQTLEDPGLIEEIILYNRKGNFDRFMAFMMVMFQIEEEDLNYEHGDDTALEDMKAQFEDLFNSMYRKN